MSHFGHIVTEETKLVIWERELGDLNSLQDKLKAFCGDAPNVKTSLREIKTEEN